MTENTPTNKPIRTIKSFVHRQRNLAPTKQKILAELWPKYGLEITNKKIDLTKIFNNQNSTIIEIGFGMGETLLHMANNFPEKNFIGIEVHMPGIGSVLSKLRTNPLTNIKIYNTDALDVLQKCVPNNSIEKFLIFFPDPWPKKRHHKRRIIQPAFVNLIATKLKPNGILHMATDWEDYAEHMMSVLTQAPQFRNTAGESKFAARPDYRPLTKFEQRGQKLGHKIWDLIFISLFHITNTTSA